MNNYNKTKKITFKVNKEQLDFLDYLDRKNNELYEHLRIDKSRARTVRMLIMEYKLNLQQMNSRAHKESLEKFPKEMSVDFYPERYDINRIIYRNKKKHDERNDESLNMFTTLSVRVSELERSFIDEQLKKTRESIGIKISLGDFIRFCIQSRMDHEKRLKERGASNQKSSNS